jgi:hypothetical protein
VRGYARPRMHRLLDIAIVGYGTAGQAAARFLR